MFDDVMKDMTREVIEKLPKSMFETGVKEAVQSYLSSKEHQENIILALEERGVGYCLGEELASQIEERAAIFVACYLEDIL